MKYFVMRLNCLMHGHDWRDQTSRAGEYRRCWRCYLER
jgi:hypothetical protein